MIAATQPQRRTTASLLHIDSRGRLRHTSRDSLSSLLHRGDVVVANDAATLPASLHGTHQRTGAAVEVRLAGTSSLAPLTTTEFTAVIFGPGTWQTRTEDRAAPPLLYTGDILALGSLIATVTAVLHHPRLIRIRFEATSARIWEGLALHGRPIQYAHLHDALELWDVWTAIAGPPVAFEAPSAGFALDWKTLRALHDKGVVFTTLTHAAGISSTGDAELDACLPFDEPYLIPRETADAINRARGRAQRIIALGTTVVRALEHAGDFGVIRAGVGLATQRLGERSRLRIVDAIVSGTHEIGSSHYELLRAFAPGAVLRRADSVMSARGYLTHEFGDSVFVERYECRDRPTIRQRSSQSIADDAPQLV